MATATARFEIEPDGENGAKLVYKGTGEIGGLVAGVGQRILASVSKHRALLCGAEKGFRTAEQRRGGMK